MEKVFYKVFDGNGKEHSFIKLDLQNITKPDFLKAINRENFVEPQKGDGEIAASLQISDEAQKRFEAEIQYFDRRIALPEYCGIYNTDKAIATALEGCSKEEQIFVYGIIRQNFLMENTSSLTEDVKMVSRTVTQQSGQMYTQTCTERLLRNSRLSEKEFL